MQKRESFTALGPLETTFHQRSIIKLSSASTQCFMTEIKGALKYSGLLAFPHLWAGRHGSIPIHTGCMKESRSQRADYNGELHSCGGRGRREWIVNNVAKKRAEIWQPQIILLPGILPKRTVLSELYFQVCEKYEKLIDYLENIPSLPA